MKNHGHGMDLDRLLRDEASTARRAPPPGLRLRILDALDGTPREDLVTLPRKAPLRHVLSLASAAAIVLFLWIVDPLDLRVESGTGAPLASVRSRISLGRDAFLTSTSRLQTTVEDPLMAELRALGEDTTGAARVLRDRLPHPLEGLFRPDRE